jgi:hypothetical protein
MGRGAESVHSLSMLSLGKAKKKIKGQKKINGDVDMG